MKEKQPAPGVHLDDVAVGHGNAQWDAAIKSLYVATTAQIFASHVITDLNMFRSKVLDWRSAALFVPKVSWPSMDDVNLSFVLNDQLGISERPFLSLRITRDNFSGELPEKLSIEEVGKRIHQASKHQFEHDEPRNIADLCKVPFLIFANKIDGRLAELSSSAEGWTASAIALRESGGESIRLTAEFIAESLIYLDQKMKAPGTRHH